jgi:uncharacterized membrane protein YgcG
MNRKLLLALVVSLVALVVVPGAASSSRLRGVVVKVDRAASTLAVARENGRVVVVKTSLASSATLGLRVDVHHGRIATLGHATSTRLRGVVARVSGTTVELAANGVHLDLDRGTVTRRLSLRARVDLVVLIGDHLTIARVREVEIENDEDVDEHAVEIEDDDDRPAADDQHGGRGDDGRDDGDRGGNRGPGGGSGGDSGGGSGRH